jgi:hypothetical protein
VGEAGAIDNAIDAPRGTLTVVPRQAARGDPDEHARHRLDDVRQRRPDRRVAIQQAERHLSGEEDSLLLALTGHIVPELEYEILRMTEGT